MNADTGQLYYTQEDIDAARSRGETVIEISQGFFKTFMEIEEAQKELNARKSFDDLFKSMVEDRSKIEAHLEAGMMNDFRQVRLP